VVTTASMTKRATLISSDGHATARMRDYRPYLDPQWRESFDEFVELWDKHGSRNFDSPALLNRCDAEDVRRFEERVAPNRLDGNYDAARRIAECDREGMAGEVLFPDFGLPFELYSPFHAASLNHPARDPAEIDVGNRAFTRWLADFCSHSPDRFRGLAPVRFDDIDSAIKEIHFAREVGMCGIVLPMFDLDAPVYAPKFDPIWSTLEDLDMVADCHPGITGVWAPPPFRVPAPHPQAAFPMFQLMYIVREMLTQMIWGGVLERHPKLKLAITEVHSGWVIDQLKRQDYSYDGSFLSRDLRTVLHLKPSEYFERQVYLGSSVFSEAEMEARERIGVRKIMLGIDYPHHEGAWNGGTHDYLRATLGAADVPEGDARLMLGENAAKVFGFDLAKLSSVADEIGPDLNVVLTHPEQDLFPRGDAHRPL
jgi:predicted TIM-barrel fold metal-dependent hydrolase